MDINGWLTVVTVFLALIAFLPQHERRLLQHIVPRWEMYWGVSILLLIVPFLLFFRDLEIRWPVLSVFTTENGIPPESIAFILFYLIFIWILVRLFIRRPKYRFSQQLVGLFDELGKELPHGQLFALYHKYMPASFSKGDKKYLMMIVRNPRFLAGLQQHNQDYLISLLIYIRNESDYKALFYTVISNFQSSIYQEIKEHDGTDFIRPNATTLHGLAVEHLDKAVEFGLRQMISAAAKNHLRSERNKPGSLYLQEHLYNHVEGEEGYELPVYYHIRFIGLIYSTAIRQMANTQPHFYTVYGGMIGEMINNLDYAYRYPEREFPTNYHWLINEIFGTISDWMDLFGTEHVRTNEDFETEEGYFYYSDNSTYIDFIPSCFGFTMAELYKGYSEEKITSGFIAKIFHYHLFGYYFRHDAKPAVLSSIEQNVIKHIPKELFPEIIDKTFDEHFVGSYDKFMSRRFSGNAREIERQDRLFKYYASIL